MNLSIDIDQQGYADALAAFIRHQGTLLPKALRFEGRQLAGRLGKLTPPRTLSQGRKAVARDIVQAVRPLRAAEFESAGIRRLIRARDYAGLEAVFGRFPVGSDLRGVSVVEARLPELHQAARDRRGRVREFQRKVTPDADRVRAYVREVQGRVGRGRAGWAVALEALGGRAPGWVRRHVGDGTGAIEDQASVSGYIRMENRSEWALGGDDDRVVAGAVRSRTRSVREALQKAQAEAIRRARL